MLGLIRIIDYIQFTFVSEFYFKTGQGPAKKAQQLYDEYRKINFCKKYNNL